MTRARLLGALLSTLLIVSMLALPASATSKAGHKGADSSSSYQVRPTFKATKKATPVIPEVTVSDQCGEPDTLTIPSSKKVRYLLDGDDVSGTTLTGPETGTQKLTITIEPKKGYVLAPGAPKRFKATLAAGEPCDPYPPVPPKTVTPEDPTLVASDECEVPGTLTIPSSDKVRYLLDGEDVTGTTITGPASGTLYVEARSGYRLANPYWSYDFELDEAEPCPQEVTPVAPELTVADECEVPDTLTIPSSDTIRYLLDGEDVTGTTLTGPLTGTLTAEAADGYILSDPDWSHDVQLGAGEPCPQEVTPVIPQVTVADECEVPDTLTVPDSDTVRYLLDGEDVTGTTITGPEAGTRELTITIEARDGYTIAPDAPASFTVVLSAGEPCPQEVTPVAPELSVADECEVPDTLTIPSSDTIRYLLDGEDVTGTTLTGPLTGTLTAEAADGYILSDPDWSHDVQLGAGEPCLVAPEAGIEAACTDDEGLLVTVTLDNSDSDVEVTYVVTIDGDSKKVVVPAGETLTVTRHIPAGTGVLDVTVAANGTLLASSTLDTAICDTEVDEVVIEDDDPDETTDPEEVTPQQPSTGGTSLPRTGASALLLTLLGLAAIGTGGTLARRRR